MEWDNNRYVLVSYSVWFIFIFDIVNQIFGSLGNVPYIHHRTISYAADFIDQQLTLQSLTLYKELLLSNFLAFSSPV